MAYLTLKYIYSKFKFNSQGVQVSMTKKNIKLKSGKVFATITLVICFALCLAVAELFSSLITVNGFSQNSSSAKVASYDIYAISLSKAQTITQGKEMGKIVMQKNGAGYVWQIDNNFYVLASAYANHADAQKVQTNLQENSTECEIIKINLPKISFELELSAAEKTPLENAINVYKNLYKKLYDISVSIDTKVKNEADAKLELNAVKLDFIKIKTNFETVFNSRITNKLLQLKLSLIDIEEILNSLYNFSATTHPLSAEIKNTYFKILHSQIKLAEQL